LQECGLSFGREIPVDEDARRVGVRVLVQQHQSAGAGTDARLLFDLIRIELGDRKLLQRRPVDPSA
jgi:hypothetical protein